MPNDLLSVFRKIIITNEIGPDMDEALKFSDPDGVRSGKSGWSFGAVQFDTKNNASAIACLKDCGFTDAEIKIIVNQTGDITPFNKRLAEHADIIEEYDERQLKRCLDGAKSFVDRYQIKLADDVALLSLADTINQYGSLGGGTAGRLKVLEHPATAEDILAIKLTWKYAMTGKHQHDDTERRHNNVVSVCKKEGV